MSNEIMNIKAPEEIELEEKLIELSGLENELAQKELDLVTLIAELHVFEILYMEVVVAKFAELDQIEAEISELIFQMNPDDIKKGRQAREAWERAEETAKSAGMAQETSDKYRFQPTEELRKLYRNAAKRLHPDLAENDEEREQRTRIMIEINQAYQEGDADKLKQIIKKWETSPEAIKGEDAGSRLIRAIRKIAQVEARLDAIHKEFEEIYKSNIYELREKTKDLANEGKDLLEEMAFQLDRQIQEAKRRLSQIKMQEAAS
jgi:hypothetical protein